jgi:hypothetical protein
MEPIIREVFEGLTKICNKEATPIDIIKTGVKILEGKPINKAFKKEILVAVLKRIAYGQDGLADTEDDKLSPETLNMLIMLIESEFLDAVIDGIIVSFKKVGLTIFDRCGVLIKFKKSS